MANYGLKTTMEGYDITSNDVAAYSFNSKYSIVKIWGEGSGSISVNNSATEIVTITHGIGFIPLVVAFCENVPSSGNYFIGQYTSIFSDTTLKSGILSLDSYVTTTDLVLKFYNNSGSNRTMYYRYYIFADDGS